jgi:hypothetical protein
LHTCFHWYLSWAFARASLLPIHVIWPALLVDRAKMGGDSSEFQVASVCHDPFSVAKMVLDGNIDSQLPGCLFNIALAMIPGIALLAKQQIRSNRIFCTSKPLAVEVRDVLCLRIADSSLFSFALCQCHGIFVEAYALDYPVESVAKGMSLRRIACWWSFATGVFIISRAAAHCGI